MSSRYPQQEQSPPSGDLLTRLTELSWKVGLVLGVGAIVVGALVLAWPGQTVLVIAILFGLYLVISGVAQLVTAAGDRYQGGARALVFVSGALSVLLGLLCFRGATQSVTLLGLWIGIAWLFRGVYMLADAANPTSGGGWQVMFAVLNIAAGIVLVVEPVTSVVVLAVVSGIWLIALGLIELFTVWRVRHVARTLRREDESRWTAQPGQQHHSPPPGR